MIFIDGLLHRRTLWGQSDCAHMISDTSIEELNSFAASIRLPQYWLQPFVFPRFEISPHWRRRALRAGAVDCAGPDRHHLYLEAMKRFYLANPMWRPGRAS